MWCHGPPVCYFDATAVGIPLCQCTQSFPRVEVSAKTNNQLEGRIVVLRKQGEPSFERTAECAAVDGIGSGVEERIQEVAEDFGWNLHAWHGCAASSGSPSSLAFAFVVPKLKTDLFLLGNTKTTNTLSPPQVLPCQPHNNEGQPLPKATKATVRQSNG